MLNLEEPEGVRVLKLLEQNFFLVETPGDCKPGGILFRLWGGPPSPLETPCVDMEFDEEFLNRSDRVLARHTLEAIRTAKTLLSRARLQKWSARQRILVSSRGVRLGKGRCNAISSKADRRSVNLCS